MKSNLKEVKDMAITFLYLDIEETEMSPLVILHPFFNNSKFYVNGDFIDILESEANFELARKEVEKYIMNECKTVSNVVSLINKPYRIVFYKYIKEFLSDTNKAELLLDIYTVTEFPNQDVNVSPKELCKYFSEVDLSSAVNKEDKEYFDSLPQVLTVYRGVSKGSEKGLSWTLSHDKAVWFANRFSLQKKNTVYIGKVKKEDIFCYTNDRNENEVILNYTKVYDMYSETILNEKGR